MCDNSMVRGIGKFGIVNNKILLGIIFGVLIIFSSQLIYQSTFASIAESSLIIRPDPPEIISYSRTAGANNGDSTATASPQLMLSVMVEGIVFGGPAPANVCGNEPSDNIIKETDIEAITVYLMKYFMYMPNND